MIESSQGVVESKRRCLILESFSVNTHFQRSQNFTASKEWIELLGSEGWKVSIQNPDSFEIGDGFELVLIPEPTAVSINTFKSLHQTGSLVAAMAVGNLNPEVVRLVDVFFCLDEQAVSLLRKLGRAAHLIIPEPNLLRRNLNILTRHLRYRRERYPQVDWSRISYGHTEISKDQISSNMVTAWQSEDIPARQRALVQTELEQMYCNNIPRVYQVLADAVKPYLSDSLTLLEIGCASGYYFEILEYLLNRTLNYSGADYSEPLIKMAKSHYPQTPFYVEDGAQLSFPDENFEIVISSCVLLHVPNFTEHIRETARVAKNAVIAHRTPVCRKRKTQYQKKYAYGVETVELLFEEAEILETFTQAGLKLIHSIEFISDPGKDEYCITFVFEKVATAESMSELLSRGEAAFTTGNIEEARTLFKMAQRLAITDARLLNNLGVLACHDGNLSLALEHFTQAYQSSSEVSKYLTNLVEILDASGRVAMAKNFLHEHLRKYPNDSQAKDLFSSLEK